MADIYKSPEGQQIVERMYRTALEQWPVPSQQLTLTTGEGDTFVIASGQPQQPPMVLLHGSGSNSAAWMRDVAEWSRQHRVYAVDMIGEPGLSAPSRPALASDRYAAWLDDVWNGLGLQSASVVGISLGGWLALDFAVRRPHRVTSLSLISPSGVGRQDPAFAIKAGLLLMLGEWGRRKARALVFGRARIAPEPGRFLATIFRHFRPRLERIPIRTDTELASLRCPVQVIVGGTDVMLRSAETRDRMTRLVPQVRMTYLANEGHILPSQTAAISAFLAEVSHIGQYRSA